MTENGLPLKFKLFLKGEPKGFLEYIPKNQVPWVETDETVLFPRFYLNSNEELSFIQQSFDEMRQFTGLYDRNGKEIYFGDKLLLFDSLNIEPPIEIQARWEDGCMAACTFKFNTMEVI